MTPVLRVAALGAGGMALLLLAAGGAYYLAGRHPALSGTGSKVARPPPTPPSLPGDPMVPDVRHAYTDAEARNRAEAEQKPGAGASVPPLDTLNPHDALPPPTARPGEAAAWERQRREQEKRQEQERERVVKAKAQGMAQVLAAWGGQHVTVEATLKPPEPERDDPAAARDDPLANWPVDRVYYGLLRVYISSDEPGPIVVQIKDGALDGARLIGRFHRADEKVVIQFDRMTFRGAWYAVEAVAIDPENGRLGLATAVDRRTFTRWAALLGSAVLQGAQRAYLSQGTQNSYLWGQTTTREFDDREILGIALGEIGTRTRQAANAYFNRPPTVYVDPAIQLVGVLFMGPPSRKTDGPGPRGAAISAPPSRATAASDRVRAATAATRTDPRDDPSENAGYDARPPAALAPVAPLPPAPSDE